MNITQIRAVVLDVKTKVDALYRAILNLKNFVDSAYSWINSSFADNFTPTDVTNFVNLQTPPYTTFLTDVETKADVLGSDSLH